MTFNSDDLSPAELAAILKHKYLLSIELGREVTLEEAIISFHQLYMDAFRKEKLRLDNLAQISEMKKHKYIKSEKEGRDVGEEAIVEWHDQFAGLWRQEQESLLNHGFHSRTLKVQNAAGVHVRPSGSIVQIVKRFDCVVYVHKEGMEHYNVKLEGKTFINVTSILTLVEMCAQVGDILDFVAYGAEAALALDEIENIVNNKFGEKK